MKVRATETGFYKGSRVRAGTEFEFEGKNLAKWMVAVDAPLSKKEVREAAIKKATTTPHEPTTLTEMAKNAGKVNPPVEA